MDSFGPVPHIIHNQVLSSLISTLPTTWTLDTSLFKARKFGDALDSHRFGVFLFNTIFTIWKLYSELITEFTTQPRGYGKTLNLIEPSESQ